MPGETMDHTSFIQWWLDYTVWAIESSRGASVVLCSM
jgi:hypothetical protein